MYNYEFCSDVKDLREFLDKVNKEDYTIISVTETHGYTIIYKDNKPVY